MSILSHEAIAVLELFCL